MTYVGGYTVTENNSAYDRGVAAGEISTRLAGHDKHFIDLNGSVKEIAHEFKEMAHELQGVKLALQRLAQAADADRSTVIVTAKALKDQEQTRRDKSENNWRPALGWASVLVALAGIGTLLWYIVSSGH